MSTSAAIGHGASFSRGDGASPEVFTALGGVTNISGPSMSKDVVDVTDMDSVERWREFIAGMKDGGEVSLELELDANGTDVTNFLADINSDAARNYRITFPDTTAWTFSAIMTALETEAPFEEKMTVSPTYKLTGKPSFIA